MKQITLDRAIRTGDILLGRGNIISSKDIEKYPGDYPIYSSSAKGTGEFGRYDHYMFNQELITWSIDGGGHFFFRPKHKFSITNVCGSMHVDEEKWNRQFVYYSLDFQHQRITFDYQIKAHPSVIRHLYSLPVVPKPEQTKIAEILSTVDQAIEQTEALIAKQQCIKTGLMQDLLTRGIDNDGNLRSEETHEFKDSPLGRIPVDWKVQSINSISDFVTSGARGWAKYYSHEGAVFLRIGNLTRDHINMRFDDTVFVQPPTNAEGLRTAVLPRDVLISVTADLGIVGVIPDDFGEGYVNQHIALIRISDTEVNQRFIAWFLQSRAGQIQIERHNEAGAKAGLNLPTIRSLLVARPSSCEQGHIAQMLDTATNAISCLQTEMTKQIRLKTALMQDLLTGDVSVTPLMSKGEIGV